MSFARQRGLCTGFSACKSGRQILLLWLGCLAVALVLSACVLPTSSGGDVTLTLSNPNAAGSGYDYTNLKIDGTLVGAGSLLAGASTTVYHETYGNHTITGNVSFESSQIFTKIHDILSGSSIDSWQGPTPENP